MSVIETIKELENLNSYNSLSFEKRLAIKKCQITKYILERYFIKNIANFTELVTDYFVNTKERRLELQFKCV